MRNESKKTHFIHLELYGRQIILLFLGSAFFVFLVFMAGLAIGKKISSQPKMSVEEIDKRHLDCLDWLEDYSQKKTSDEPKNEPNPISH